MTAQNLPIIVGAALCALLLLGYGLVALVAHFRKSHLPTFGTPRQCDCCGKFSHPTLYNAGYGYRWLCDACRGRMK